MTDLTTPIYWERRQNTPAILPRNDPLNELLEAMVPFLKAYEGKDFLEIGCSPGLVSSEICRRLHFEPFGVDSSPGADIYLTNMKNRAGVEASLAKCDVRDYWPQRNFNVVTSFGLVEHFSDPVQILLQHDRLCRPGGLVVVSVPNFRYVQWVYHYLLDRSDLRRHNTQIMTLDTFSSFASLCSHDILLLGHIGRVSFWNSDQEGSVVGNMLRKIVSFGICTLTSDILAPLLPADSPFYSPWILYIGRKKPACV